jgi:DNA-binding NarL/FixJ family response regulator
MSPMKILIADDYPKARYGLRFLLECEPDMEIIGETDNGLPALEAVQALHPDLLVLDINTPALAGLDVLKRLRKDGNPIPVIMLADHADTCYAKAALEAGATAFLGKDGGFDALISTIQCIHENHADQKHTAFRGY